ncbi:MAG: sigma-70 family RNA polymerase sigma factor, partial [Planctomycetes bacterium]|nr:sigma-70 family RNA polymerase sigma factor [Planctomycetota bacterium]
MRSSHDLGLDASRGDAAAIDELLVRHLPSLRAYVRLKAGPVVRAREAESDVVQSVCREVLQRQGEFRFGGEGGFRHWLFRTALRKILDKHKLHTAERRDVRREQAPVRGQDGSAAALAFPDPLAAFATPSAVAIGRERFEQIAAAFDRLPPDHAEVVLLSRVVGLSRADVAQAMDR